MRAGEGEHGVIRDLNRLWEVSTDTLVLGERVRATTDRGG